MKRKIREGDCFYYEDHLRIFDNDGMHSYGHKYEVLYVENIYLIFTIGDRIDLLENMNFEYAGNCYD